MSFRSKYRTGNMFLRQSQRPDSDMDIPSNHVLPEHLKFRKASSIVRLIDFPKRRGLQNRNTCEPLSERILSMSMDLSARYVPASRAMMKLSRVDVGIMCVTPFDSYMTTRD